jgi:hypothetical protein
MLPARMPPWCLIGALGLVTLTIGSVQDSQYPTAGYGLGYTTGYGSRPCGRQPLTPSLHSASDTKLVELRQSRL